MCLHGVYNDIDLPGGCSTVRWHLIAVLLLFLTALVSADDKPAPTPTFRYEVARAHELKPHRRAIPIEGVEWGANQIHLRIMVSPAGDVLDVHPSVDVDPPSYAERTLRFWPQLEGEVRGWKFTPFEQNGIPVAAEIEEYLDLIPPERPPKVHVAPPSLQRNSRVSISLSRSGCFGTCPSYVVTASTDGIIFEGNSYVVAHGKHVARVDANKVRELAAHFVKADFYSMEPKYEASITDNPTYVLSIDIDGHKKTVEDYVGVWEGMPSIITELEDQVDALAGSERWVSGTDGLVKALQGEKFNFQSFEAQLMLKDAAERGQVEAVRQFVAAGVPLYRLPVPSTNERRPEQSFLELEPGLLASAVANPQGLQTLIEAGASRDDQQDKDRALAVAARYGSLEAVRALISYGANPKAEFSNSVIKEPGGMEISQRADYGSVLLYAAQSGNSEIVREILQHHPNLEARDNQGRTAMFVVGEFRRPDKERTPVECIRLLAQAGADVNARDNRGNTPLHENYSGDVVRELLKLGADVNARNKNGETPIFTNLDDESLLLLIQHGADLTIRNNKGEDIGQAAGQMGQSRQEALRKAIESLVQH